MSDEKRSPDRQIVIDDAWLDRAPRHALTLEWIIGENRFDRVEVHRDPYIAATVINVYDSPRPERDEYRAGWEDAMHQEHPPVGIGETP